MKTEAFCWHCQQKLMPKKGGGYAFAVVIDQLGNKHRVHKVCLDRCIRVDGVKLYKEADHE